MPVYVKKTLWTGMSTTGKRESMNAFFNKYVLSNTTLKQFLSNMKILFGINGRENRGDYESFNSTMPCLFDYYIEQQFQVAYTNAKF